MRAVKCIKISWAFSKLVNGTPHIKVEKTFGFPTILESFESTFLLCLKMSIFALFLGRSHFHVFLNIQRIIAKITSRKLLNVVIIINGDEP